MFSRWRSAENSSAGQDGRLPDFRRVLEQARRGDAEGLSVLYRSFLPGVFAYIAARVPDRATAEDLTSDVFLEMVEGIGRLRASEEAGVAAWLFQIARITVASYYRKREKLPATVSLDAALLDTTDDENSMLFTGQPGADPVNLAEARDEWHVVVKAINMLTEEQRQVLIGRLILGYDVATVAKMIGKKANAVKALQFRALNALQRLLGREQEGATSSRTRQGGRML
ncbi:MAG: sigma-70 family RNA polymerase sigma factor [Ktedonobacteraceae bacterium]|nr:sigma-70 family RNA polymerase sigma factor [Ktedonobacteraceae bacterium]